MYQISVQRAVKDNSIPSTKQLKQWAQAALKNKLENAEVTLRVVNKAEITELNSIYRKKNKPTNVLSFPLEFAELDLETHLLGDIVICAEVVAEEASAQNKSVDAHWAHMVVHGILHLLGYDHEKDSDAEIMESEEIVILEKLGFSNPYQET